MYKKSRYLISLSTGFLLAVITNYLSQTLPPIIFNAGIPLIITSLAKSLSQPGQVHKLVV